MSVHDAIKRLREMAADYRQRARMSGRPDHWPLLHKGYALTNAADVIEREVGDGPSDDEYRAEIADLAEALDSFTNGETEG
jgi:hypothetical protein